MNAIQIISKCAASGVHLEAGRVYAVPAEVTEHDAASLVRMGRAVGATLPEGQADALADKPARSRKAKAAE